MERHHRIDYVEFAVTDVAAAKAFYGAAFGWEFTDYGRRFHFVDPFGNELGVWTETSH